jgi:hypothetical protein
LALGGGEWGSGTLEGEVLTVPVKKAEDCADFIGLELKPTEEL